MGQKVTPTGFRLGITYKPQSQWFVDPRSGSMKKIYPPLILEDRFIRNFITQKFPRTAIAQILIYRTLDYIKIEIHTAQAKKFSYQSVSKSSKTRSTDNNNANLIQENSSQTEHSSISSDREKNTTPPGVGPLSGSLPSSGHSNLKNLQQDLQIALLKYKKTLRIFSSWKHDSFYKSNNNGSLDQKYEKTNLLEDETQELPKLWSYEASNFALSKNSNNDMQNEFQPKTENSTWATESDSSQIEVNSVNERESNSDTELNFIESKEKVKQHIGIVVKQLNQPFQYASIFAKYLVSQLERRENSVKQALNRSLKLIQNYNIQGIKIKVSGRLNGVDMAETENILKGRIPLSTISANIDYHQDIAQTLYGTLGVKVFIYR